MLGVLDGLRGRPGRDALRAADLYGAVSAQYTATAAAWSAVGVG